MRKVQIVLSGTFFADVALYFATLCMVLWLVATMLELTKAHPERRREFYRGTFWVVYMFSSLVCGIFVLSTEVETSSKPEVLMVLLVADILIAGKVSVLLEVMAVKAGGFIKNFRQRFM